MFGKNKSSFMEDFVLSKTESLRSVNTQNNIELSLQNEPLKQKQKIHSLRLEKFDEYIEKIVESVVIEMSYLAGFSATKDFENIVECCLSYSEKEIEELKSFFINSTDI